MFWRHRPILQFLFSPSVKYGNVKLGMPERLWFRAARTFQPINLRRFGVCALGTIGNWHTAWYDRGIYHIPIWERWFFPDSDRIHRFSIRQVCSSTWVLLPFQTKTCTELELDWHRFAQIPVASGVTLRHDVICETVRASTTDTLLFCTIYMVLCYVDSLDVNFRCRKASSQTHPKKKKNLERSK